MMMYLSLLQFGYPTYYVCWDSSAEKVQNKCNLNHVSWFHSCACFLHSADMATHQLEDQGILRGKMHQAGNREDSRKNQTGKFISK